MNEQTQEVGRDEAVEEVAKLGRYIILHNKLFLSTDFDAADNLLQAINIFIKTFPKLKTAAAIDVAEKSAYARFEEAVIDETIIGEVK